MINTQNKRIEYAEQVQACWILLDKIARNYTRTAIPEILKKDTKSSVQEFFLVTDRIDHYCMQQGDQKPELVARGLSQANVIQRLVKETWTDEKGTIIC